MGGVGIRGGGGAFSRSLLVIKSSLCGQVLVRFRGEGGGGGEGMYT